MSLFKQNGLVKGPSKLVDLCILLLIILKSCGLNGITHDYNTVSLVTVHLQLKVNGIQSLRNLEGSCLARFIYVPQRRLCL